MVLCYGIFNKTNAPLEITPRFPHCQDCAIAKIGIAITMININFFISAFLYHSLMNFL